MDYINGVVDNIKSTLEGIKTTMSNIMDVLGTIGDIIGTIAEILGFIGFKVFLLLLSTSFIMWILNLVSPVNRKINYFLSVGIVLWLAITTKMSFQSIILKYILIILSPFILIYLVNFLIKLGKIIYDTLKVYIKRIDLPILRKKIQKLNENDNIALLFTTDLPTLQDIEDSKSFIKNLKYNLSILENEKIALTDSQKRIIFSNELKLSQFIKSSKSKDVKLLWFWSQSYKTNELLEQLKTIEKIKQSKDIIGCGDNSYILNFLQNKWNWSVIYGKNFKDFIKTEIKGDFNLSNYIFNQNNFELNLINNFNLPENYFLKSNMVGSDLSVLASTIGTSNFLTFKNDILFLSCDFKTSKRFYREFLQLINFIIDKKYQPQAIIINNLFKKDVYYFTNIIQSCNKYLKDNKIDIPVFEIRNMNFIRLNTKYTIEFKENKIILKLLAK